MATLPQDRFGRIPSAHRAAHTARVDHAPQAATLPCRPDPQAADMRPHDGNLHVAGARRSDPSLRLFSGLSYKTTFSNEL
jgi:hypothetical protein